MRTKDRSPLNPKVTVYVAISLDGFLARPDGDLDWLDEASKEIPAGEDCGYGQMMKTVDCLVLGRKTFEKVLSFGGWPYGDLPVRVLSTQADLIPPDLPETVSQIQGPPQDVCAALAGQGFSHLYVDGGQTIQAFLEAGLVDEMTLTLVPILLGQGLRLFGSLTGDRAWRFESVEHFEFGLVQLKLKPAQPHHGHRPSAG